MAEHTHIEWTDATWQPITGCSVVSPGCTNCYAMRLAGTRLRHHPSRARLTRATKAGPVWTGEVRLNEEWLTQPLSWKRPRRIFVCAHGDLFHENVPDDLIDRVFAVMALAPQHTFQVLTKRAKRMRRYIAQDRMGYIEGRAKRILRERSANPARPVMVGKTLAGTWPWPHVWLGVSVEDQPRADERIPHLRVTPAHVRFLSCEPVLAPIFPHLAGIGWVICGSESGPGARPCDLAWVRSLRDQCVAAGVPFFFKQHVVNGRKVSTPELDGRAWRETPDA